MAGLETGRPLLAPVQRQPYYPYEIHQDVFSSEECAAIIALGLDLELTTATLEDPDSDGIEDHTIRRSSMGWIPPDEDNMWVFERIGDLAELVNQRYEFELSGFGEDLQFTVYDGPGAFYSWHQDGLDGDLSARKLSFVIQLSDPDEYEGAELQLFEVAEDYSHEQLDDFTFAASRQGAAVAFPAFEYHRVLPLRNGVRYSLVCWLSGPPFR